jgi:hypothetical protein
MFRPIRPWGSPEVAFGTYELRQPQLSINAGAVSILFNVACACAGGGSGGEFLVKRN